MLIESYVVEFKEVKKCISSLRADDYIIVSENIFALTEKVAVAKDLLSGSTPENHPEALLLVNKEYAKNLLMNEEFFEFLKQSHDIENMHGVTLHLAFANADLINELNSIYLLNSQRLGKLVGKSYRPKITEKITSKTCALLGCDKIFTNWRSKCCCISHSRKYAGMQRRR
jgi:hypothetical protein